MWCEVGVQIHFSACGNPFFPETFTEKPFFSHWDILAYIENQLTTNTLIYFWTQNFIPLIYISICMVAPYTLDYFENLIVFC